MESSTFRPRAVVIGGGVIGLVIARELCAAGWIARILEKGAPGCEASSAAAGMIAPRLEFSPSDPLLGPALASKELYPEFVRKLEAETGFSVDLRLHGVLSPRWPTDPPLEDREGARRIRGAKMRESFEPSFAPAIEEAHFFEGEGSVDNRALVRALLKSVENLGVEIVSGAEAEAEEVLTSGGRACGVRTRDRTFGADLVFNCAGAWAGKIKAGGSELKIKPIKGQMLLLQTQGSAPGPSRTLYSPRVYVVPRSDGRVILGTTVEDRGYDKTVEAGVVSRLLDEGIKLCPVLKTARFVESWAGLRPLLEDCAAPRIGPEGPDGYFTAVGHYRNGILLTPLTARMAMEAVTSVAR